MSAAAVRLRLRACGPDAVVVRVSDAGSMVAAVRDACGVLGASLASELTREPERHAGALEEARAPAGATLASLWVRPYTVALATLLARWSTTGEWPRGALPPVGGLDELPAAAAAADAAIVAARALTAADAAGCAPAELARVAASALAALGPWGALALLGLRRTRLSLARAPPSVAEMRASFELVWKAPGALSVGARALSKHWHRAPDSARFWVDDWVGSEADKTARASAALERLFREAVWANCHRLPLSAAARAADVFELRMPSGYGARWAADGASFRGFLEPQAWDTARWAGTSDARPMSASEAEAVTLTGLTSDMLIQVLTFVDPDDELAVSLACRKLRDARRARAPARRPLTTAVRSLLASPSKLQWGLACGAPQGGRLLAIVAGHGDLRLLSWLRAHGRPWSREHWDWVELSNSAALGGHHAVLQWLHAECAQWYSATACDGLESASEWSLANGCPWNERTCACAAEGGHTSVLQWLRARGCPWDEATCSEAAAGAHLALLQWARADGCPWGQETCKQAAQGGHLSVLQWAHANGCPWDAWACSQAAAGGHLAVLQWLRANHCPWSELTCLQAAASGHLSVLQWARAEGCPWDERVCSAAAAGGHLSVLQWARASGCPWDAETCEDAARGGHLAVLQWARAHGGSWDARTCSAAGGGGHLAVLQWARANGCSWDEKTCADAARGGHLAVLQWARANGCPWNADTCSRAARHGHLSVLQWAHANGCPWNKQTSAWAFAGGHLAAWEWARANGCPCD